MFEFYTALDSANPNAQNLAMTVIDGPSFGEKALVSGGRLVYESGSFFSAHESEVLALADGGTYAIDGQSVFCELLGNEKKVFICGGGHISIPIITMGLMIGCRVTVIEDRPSFADNARRAGATEVICDDFEHGLAGIPGDEDTFFVIVTRGHRHDQACLRSIVRKPHAYIGMIGSRKRVATVKEALLAEGADPEVIERVYTPIGLKIGAETPEEIAIAILAEIIQVKNAKKRNCGYSREIMRAILADENEKKALATIVMRKGSAPREVGTKMLFFADGRTVGTIGGGCVEADVQGKARRMLLLPDAPKRQLFHVDMTGRDAEDEGMVCGGIIDVLVEAI